MKPMNTHGIAAAQENAGKTLFDSQSLFVIFDPQRKPRSRTMTARELGLARQVAKNAQRWVSLCEEKISGPPKVMLNLDLLEEP